MKLLSAYNTALLVVLSFSSATLAKEFRHKTKQSILVSNGSEASKGEFPHIVQLKRNGGHACSGSILDENTVVTSCRCVVGNASEYTVIAGEHDLDETEGSEQSRQVSEIICHPRFNAGTFSNDIAILKTTVPFTLNNTTVKAIPISNTANPNSFTVAGWGETTHGGNVSRVLQKISVDIQSNRRCTSSAIGDVLEPGMICAGTLEQGPCEGDGGDPMMANGYLYGFVSFRNQCGYYGVASVYTSTSFYYNWIMSHYKNLV